MRRRVVLTNIVLGLALLPMFSVLSFARQKGGGGGKGSSFTECSPSGYNCNILVTLDRYGVLTPTSNPDMPYYPTPNGYTDIGSLIGFKNNSNATVYSIRITESNTLPYAFVGLVSSPAYNAPNVKLINIPSASNYAFPPYYFYNACPSIPCANYSYIVEHSADVVFTGGIPKGGSTYFTISNAGSYLGYIQFSTTPVVPQLTFQDTLIVGQTANATLTLYPPNPATVTLTLAPTTGTGSAVFAANNSTTLTVNTSNSPVQIPIKGVLESSITGNLNSTASLNGVQRGLNFTVQAPDFTVAVSPNSQIADYGGQASYSVSITGLYGFASAVSLSASNLPSGATASFNPAAISPGQTSTMTISTSGVQGTFTLTVTGVGGGLTHSTTAQLQINPPTPRILLNGTDITGSTTNVIVGQQINLSYSVGGTVQSYSWSVPGTTVGGYSASTLSGSTTAADFSQASPSFYWVDSGSRTVTVSVTVNGVSGTGTTTFNVVAPSASMSASSLDSSYITINTRLGFLAVTYGPSGPSGGTHFSYTYTIPIPDGSFQWVQVFSSTTTHRTVASTGTVATRSCSGVLDTTYPYDTFFSTNDTPSEELSVGYSAKDRSDSAIMTLMFQPSTAAAIFVPVANVSWSWGFSATSSDGGSTWTLTSTTAAGSLNPSATTTFPTWSGNAINCSYQ